MDLSYVGYAVARWPWLSPITYGALVALATWHAVGGLAIVGRRSGWTKAARAAEEDSVDGEEIKPPARASRKSLGGVSWRAGLTALATAVTGIALYRLAKDVFVSKAMGARIEYVHRRVASLVYR